jgi:hypothetical protein
VVRACALAPAVVVVSAGAARPPAEYRAREGLFGLSGAVTDARSGRVPMNADSTTTGPRRAGELVGTSTTRFAPPRG